MWPRLDGLQAAALQHCKPVDIDEELLAQRAEPVGYRLVHCEAVGCE